MVSSEVPQKASFGVVSFVLNRIKMLSYRVQRTATNKMNTREDSLADAQRLDNNRVILGDQAR